MRLVSKLAIAAFALGSLSTSASAAVHFTFQSGASEVATQSGSTTVVDFDHANATGWITSGPTFPALFTTSLAAEPAHDTTAYGAGEPAGADGGSFTIMSPNVLTNLSVYVGSIDTYNTVTFIGTGTGFSQSFDGTTNAITGLNSIGSGNQSSNATNRRYFFTFGAADGVNEIVFSSTQPAFEFDNVSILSGVPEPATWTMMILGFGFIGFMMRSNRQKSAMIAA